MRESHAGGWLSQSLLPLHLFCPSRISVKPPARKAMLKMMPNTSSQPEAPKQQITPLTKMSATGENSMTVPTDISTTHRIWTASDGPGRTASSLELNSGLWIVVFIIVKILWERHRRSRRAVFRQVFLCRDSGSNCVFHGCPPPRRKGSNRPATEGFLPQAASFPNHPSMTSHQTVVAEYARKVPCQSWGGRPLR